MARSLRRRARTRVSPATVSVLGMLIVGVLAAVPAEGQDDRDGSAWPQFRGPNVDGTAPDLRVFTNVGEFDRQVSWTTTIGAGYSGVSIDDALVATMFDTGESTVVAAYHSGTGEERWRSVVGPHYSGVNGSFAGPISTPLIAGNAIIALDRQGRLVGLAASSGDQVWGVDLIGAFESQPGPQGFATSPILFEGQVIVQTGGPGAAVTAFDPATGVQLWSVGEDAVFYQTPVPVTLGGQEQLVVAGVTTVMGIDPEAGQPLWEYGHGGDGWAGAESLVPVSAGPDRLLLAHSDDSSAAVDLEQGANGLIARERWNERTIRNSYNVSVFHDGYLYGYNRFFLVCVDADTGEAMWRSRPPGDGFTILVDGHLVLTKDGSLHVIKASPERYEEVASLQLFDDVVWTPPSFADGRIYARSQSELARIDISSVARLSEAGIGREDVPSELVNGRFEQFLREVGNADNQATVVDRFLNSVEEFPLVENDRRVHFLYQGPGEGIAIAGDMIGARKEQPMTRVEETDLFYYSTEIDPNARVNYHFLGDDGAAIIDPRNPRATTTAMYTPEMEPVTQRGAAMPVSWVAMPRWQPPGHLTEPPSDTRRGRLVTHEIESQVLGQTFTFEVYVPADYDAANERRYPVVYYHELEGPLEKGSIVTSLDNLLVREAQPVIAVFVEADGANLLPLYVDMWADEVVPLIDRTYRTVTAREGRASVGNGFTGFTALQVAFRKPDLVGKAASQSPAHFVFEGPVNVIQQFAVGPREVPMDLYIDWGQYDAQAPHENWDLRESLRGFVDVLTRRGYIVHGGEVPDGTGWSSWKNRTDRVLRSLFPLE